MQMYRVKFSGVKRNWGQEARSKKQEPKNKKQEAKKQETRTKKQEPGTRKPGSNDLRVILRLFPVEGLLGFRVIFYPVKTIPGSGSGLPFIVVICRQQNTRI